MKHKINKILYEININIFLIALAVLLFNGCQKEQDINSRIKISAFPDKSGQAVAKEVKD